MKPLVIYHAKCMDGVSAAWVFWLLHKDNFEYHPGVYGEEIPPCKDRIVYLVDFSYNLEKMLDMVNQAKSVTLIDHHATALNALKGFIDLGHCSVEYSGAMLAWRYWHKRGALSRVAPPFLYHVQDRDLWKFEYTNTRPIMEAAFSYPITIEQIDVFMQMTHEELAELAKEGAILERKKAQDVENIIRSTLRWITLFGMAMPTVNTNGQFASDVGASLVEKWGIGMTYFDTKDNRVCSLRSNGDIDVSKLAELYCGGGHPKAAGFKIPRDNPLAQQ